MMPIGLRLLATLVALAALVMSGCGGAASAKPVFASPQEAVDAFQGALARGDWGAAFDCMGERGQKTLALGLMFAMDPASKAGDAWRTRAEAIAEKHGVGQAAMAKRRRSTDIEKDFDIVADMITDRRGFFVEAMTLIKEHNPSFQLGGTATLSDVAVSGNCATGLLTSQTPSSGQYDVSFEKVGGSWLIADNPKPRMALLPLPPTPSTAVPAPTAGRSPVPGVSPPSPSAPPPAVPAHAASGENLLKPGESYGALRMGMTVKEMTAAIGRPKDVFAGKLYRYPDRGLTVGIDDSSRVIFIIGGAYQKDDPRIAAFKGQTPEGIGIGATEEDIRKAYGEPASARSPVPERRVLQYESLRTTFTLLDGRLVEVRTNAPK